MTVVVIILDLIVLIGCGYYQYWHSQTITLKRKVNKMIVTKEEILEIIRSEYLKKNSKEAASASNMAILFENMADRIYSLYLARS